MATRLPRLHFVHGPTPIERADALGRKLGVELWIKRDDATGGAEAGNKLRKLEMLLADALAKKANVVVTCGGIQSNHARATALMCAKLGVQCVLVLRVQAGLASDPLVRVAASNLPHDGNVLLDRLAGADIRFISPADWEQRNAVLESVALALEREGKKAYVIPEGGSNGLGALGYVEAMREVAEQRGAGLAGGPGPFDEVVVACGSGGSAAGVALGAARFGVARRARAVAVCDDAKYFEAVIRRISQQALALDGELAGSAPVVVDDSARGPAYAVMSEEQKRFLVDAARTGGLVLDPVYTGKALFGLARAVERGDVGRGSRVLFVHTGGLPGLLAQGGELASVLT